jgi:hypothetical protein
LKKKRKKSFFIGENEFFMLRANSFFVCEEEKIIAIDDVVMHAEHKKRVLGYSPFSTKNC